MRLLLLYITITLSCTSTAQLLFPICGENGKWGYMNEDGAWEIQPQFHAATEFSEGLAAVRQGGLYGYITSNGQWQFEPQFEYARPFKSGRAIVYSGEQPSVLLSNGEFLYRNAHQIMEYPESEFLLVVLNTSMELELLNDQNEVVHSATGGSAYAILPRLLVVSFVNEDGVTESRLINQKGDILYTKQPTDEFYSVGDRILIVRTSGAIIEADILNNEGKITSTISNSILDPAFMLYHLHFNDDKAITRIYVNNHDPNENRYSAATALAILDDDGTITPFPDTIKSATGIVNNRMFVRNIDNKWWLCDTGFNKIGNFDFQGTIIPINRQQFATPPFTHGYMGVMYKDDWYSVNELGRISNHMEFSEFADPHIINDGVIRYSRNGYESNPIVHGRVYGLWDLTKGSLVPAVYNYIASSELSTSWYVATQGSKSGYIRTDNTRLGFLYNVPYSPVNIDHRIRMLRFIPLLKPDSNSRAILSTQGHFEKVESPKKGDLYLQLWTPPAELKSGGMMVHVVNGQHHTEVKLNSVDGELLISIEAKDENGNWKTITDFPTSWCGNSFYTVNIPPQHQATYAFPEFEGSFETELRVALSGIVDESDENAQYDRNGKTIYSDTFRGSINPAQLWRSHLAVP